MCVHTLAQVLTGVGACRNRHSRGRYGPLRNELSPPSNSDNDPLTNGALVHILVTRAAGEARWASADGPAIHRVCVADSILVAGIADTGIVQMTQKPWEGTGRGQGQTLRRCPKAPQTRSVFYVLFLLTCSIFSSSFFLFIMKNFKHTEKLMYTPAT